MNVNEENETTGGDQMVGAALFIEKEIKEEPVCLPEEESEIPYFSVNNNPLDIKSEDFLVQELPINKEKHQIDTFSANNDPLNIKSEDVDIVVENGSTNASLPKERPKSTKDYMVGEIIEAVVDIKQENDSSVRMDEHPTNTSGSVTPEGYTYDSYSGTIVCKTCGLALKNRNRFKEHLLLHKSLSEVPVYKCDKCPFATRYKCSLQSHISNRHGHPSQLKKFSCEKCSYKVNQASVMKRHFIRNHTPMANTKKEKKLYKCSSCDYTNNTKFKVIYHSRRHKTPSEVPMDKCPLCPYQSKYPSGVANHMLFHKSSSETALYKCELCSYESKWRHCLRNHIKAHEKKSEHPPIRKCASCEFTTNNIYSLEIHMKSHRVPPKKPKEIYSCFTCGHQTKDKRVLTRHVLSHKPLSQLEMFECAQCGIRMKFKSSLIYHIMIKHGPLADIEIKPNFL